MRQELERTILGINPHSLDDVKPAALKVLENVRRTSLQIGYAAGIITSDGPKLIQRNIAALLEATASLQEQHNFPLFCAADIFTKPVYSSLVEMQLDPEAREERFIAFWRNILRSGLVTDVFMTERSEFSRGAKDEHQTALEQGLNIHYHDEQTQSGLSVIIYQAT